MLANEFLAVAGFFVGLAIGWRANRSLAGCVPLLVVPVAMIAYIAWWQDTHPEALRSTSGLDFVFGPILPSMAALAGYFLSFVLRDKLDERKD